MQFAGNSNACTYTFYFYTHLSQTEDLLSLLVLQMEIAAAPPLPTAPPCCSMAGIGMAIWHIPIQQTLFLTFN